MNYTSQTLVNLKKEHSSFQDNIWGTDLEDMQLISIYNDEIRFLLFVIGTYNKYAWVVLLKDYYNYHYFNFRLVLVL